MQWIIGLFVSLATSNLTSLLCLYYSHCEDQCEFLTIGLRILTMSGVLKDQFQNQD